MTEEVNTLENFEETEDAVMYVMTNEESKPIPVDNILLVFKRPDMKRKYQQRSWARRKLKEFKIDQEENNNDAFLWQYWGSLNAYVIRLYVLDSQGKVKFEGKKYSEYFYDETEDIEYGSLFEKYAVEEVYNKGKSEEDFVSRVILEHAQWLNSAVIPQGDDIKNS